MASSGSNSIGIDIPFAGSRVLFDNAEGEDLFDIDMGFGGGRGGGGVGGETRAGSED